MFPFDECTLHNKILKMMIVIKNKPKMQSSTKKTYGVTNGSRKSKNRLEFLETACEISVVDVVEVVGSMVMSSTS